MPNTFEVLFQGQHEFTIAIEKVFLAFVKCSLLIFVDNAIAETYTVDQTDDVLMVQTIDAWTFADFIEGRKITNTWLGFVRKDRTNATGTGIDTNEAIGVTTESVITQDKISFEMKRGATVLTEGEADLLTRLVTFQLPPTLTLSISEFFLWNRLLDTVSASIESV